MMWMVVIVGVLVAAAGPAAAQTPVDAEHLRRGLIAIHRDGSQPPHEVVQREATIALALKPGEAPHPRLTAGAGVSRWQGFVTILRAGDYRFSARLRGRLRLVVAGKVVLEAEAKDKAAALVEGPTQRLEAGVQELTAELTWPGDGAAQVELCWQAPFFRREPLPYDQLGHLPAKAPARLALDEQIERGRFVAEERSCASCHQPGDGDRLARGLQARQGPDLSKVGERAFPGWLFRWLEAPQSVRPEAVMPALFADDEAGHVERYCVASYLASLGGPLEPAAKAPQHQVTEIFAERGEGPFTSLGCIACHGKETRGGLQIPLKGLGSKTTADKLATYLENPLAVDPSGRMPHLLLQGDEPRNLAWYLVRDKDPAIGWQLPDRPAAAQLLAAFRHVESRPDEAHAFQQLAPAAQVADLGKRLVIAKGCNHCHTIAPGGKPFASVLAPASWDDIQKPACQGRGCLAEQAQQRGQAPWFALGASDREALRRFLREGARGGGAPAPAHAARVTLQRFRCLACHTKDGEGGLASTLIEDLRRQEKAENAEAVAPPPLTGIAHKLRAPWLRQVLTQAARARPWMGLHMPQFGEAQVGRLPEALAAVEGIAPHEAIDQVPLTAAAIEAGRRLVGKEAFGCISCHDLAGVPNTGTRGPDLASMDQRVQLDWYRRWLDDAQRMQPGTRMPTVFLQGKSLVPHILGGSADAQAEALWAYLSLGPGLPLPEGLGPPPGLVLTVKDRPVLLRTFMPDAGSRALAVGYPGGISAAFDAAGCRLAYAWSGNFLDAGPVWNDRGGNPASLMGPRFWNAPAGCPWAVTTSHEPPDFGAQAQDPAYGATLPEGKIYQGPRHIAFAGYTVDARGWPTFRYRLNADEAHPVEVGERPEPLRTSVATGVSRRFHLTVPGRGNPWFRAGESRQLPRLLDGRGEPLPLTFKGDVVELPASDRWLLLAQEGERGTIVQVAEAPPGTRWRLHRQGSSWQVLLQLPAVDKGEVRVRVDYWVPYRNDPRLWKELHSSNP
jgi:cbb3-type cytochrome oxidase cytochrome c subunit